MIDRCTNPKAANYDRYGGRGIKVCAEWAHFENFLTYMGERPLGMTLEREDTNGNYGPGNCKWATASEQQRNKRSFVQPKGRTYGDAQCRHCGTTYTRRSPVSVNCPEHTRCRV